jgi:hypothetical protein
MTMNENTINKKYLKVGHHNVLPADGAAGWNAGHKFTHTQLGVGYTNIGGTVQALFRDDGEFFKRYTLTERFDLLPKLIAAWDLNATFSDTEVQTALHANRNFTIIGTNASADDITHADGGGIKIETDGADADQVILQTVTTTPGPGSSAWGVAKWNTNDEIVFEAVIKTGSAVTAQIIWAGFKLTNTPTIATDNDQAFVRYSSADSSGVWTVNDSATGVDTSSTTALTVAADTIYYIKIVVGTDRIPRYTIVDATNGTVAEKVGAALTADVDLKPFVGIQASAAAAKHYYLGGVRLGKTFGNN